MCEQEFIFLICTVGTCPAPIVVSLKHWRPARVWFVASDNSLPEIAEKIVPLAQDEGVDLDQGRYDVLKLPDAQNLEACLEKLRDLTAPVQRWLQRDERCRVVVDFTGGTKCMSAATVLQAHRWHCDFSYVAYVGGTERTKGGEGTVVSGEERLVQVYNPWDALGFEALEDFITLFDRYAFAVAGELAENTMRQMSDQSRKRELHALQLLANAYDAWDRFDRKVAMQQFAELNKCKNDLHAVLGSANADRVEASIKSHLEHLHAFQTQPEPSECHIRDLLSNARRRQEEKRFDDGVARLYRAIEAMAQLALAKRHDIPSTKDVPLERIPEQLRSEWSYRVQNGTLSLGLQDAYRLLVELGDELGRKFHELGLDDREHSTLTARNQSILAHGFDCVSDKTFTNLWKAALELASTFAISEQDLPKFPKLSPKEGASGKTSERNIRDKAAE